MKWGIFIVILLIILGLAALLLLPDYLVPGKQEPEIQVPEKQAREKEHREGTEKEHRQLQVHDLASLYPKLVFRAGNPDRPLISLTFDDGPDNRYTPQILDILKNKGVKATFFITGIKAEKYPQVLRRINLEGHQIGSHGYQHEKFSNLEPEGIKDDFSKMETLLKNTLGSLPEQKIFRPPFGALDPQSVETIDKLGYKIVLWNVDSLDWRSLTANQVVENILSKVKNGSIILQHSAAGGPEEDLSGTVKALDTLITKLRAKGFRFVTIRELMENL